MEDIRQRQRGLAQARVEIFEPLDKSSTVKHIFSRIADTTPITIQHAKPEIDDTRVSAVDEEEEEEAMYFKHALMKQVAALKQRQARITIPNNKPEPPLQDDFV